jgi:hypothetical protein
MQTHVEPNVYEFVIIHCRPEHILQFYTKVQERKKMYEKYGAKTLGLWLAEAGSVGTFYVLREWPSMMTRVQAREKMWNDQEWQRLYKETSMMITYIQSFLCKTPPNMPIKPMKTTGTHVMLHKLKPKKFSVFAAQKYRDIMTDINKMISTDLMTPVATLVPLVYDEFCMLTIWEVSDSNLDTTYQRMVECRRDPTNWEKISEFQETYLDEMNVLALPVTATGTPRMAF